MFHWVFLQRALVQGGSIEGQGIFLQQLKLSPRRQRTEISVETIVVGSIDKIVVGYRAKVSPGTTVGENNAQGRDGQPSSDLEVSLTYHCHGDWNSLVEGTSCQHGSEKKLSID